MPLFILGLIAALVAVVLLAAPSMMRERALGILAGIAGLLLSAVLIGFSSAVSVDDNQRAVVIRTFGESMPQGRVVALDGQAGAQARLLGPGWHFGYWPWMYEFEVVPTVTIDQGKVGVLTALDGRPLPEGQVFAPAWSSANDMLDGDRFLAPDGGFKGPQATVLTPGSYPFNPKLFRIDQVPATLVNVGEVAVIKANAGPEWKPGAEEKIIEINGTRLVPNGNQGIWKTALAPGLYNLHPGLFQVTKVQTTNRVYTYQDDKWAIKVRSRDGFTFPVDVRVGVTVTADQAPFLVAMLGNPDLLQKDEQEDEPLSRIESKIILPLIRTHFRNVAETMNALQFMNSRTQVESDVSRRMRDELAKYRLETDGVFIGQIELDATPEGKTLLATQTDREVALNQQKTFEEKKRAEESRATFIKAQEEAEQQRKVVAATYQVQVREQEGKAFEIAASYTVKVKEQEAKAREAEARGEASFIEITSAAKRKAYADISAAIGPQGLVTIEALRLVGENKIQITPQVMVGSGGSALDALAGTILGRGVEKK